MTRTLLTSILMACCIFAANSAINRPPSLVTFESSEPETRNSKLETLGPLATFESSEPETRNSKLETLGPLVTFESSEPETRNAKLETLRPLVTFESSERETRNAELETLPPLVPFESSEPETRNAKRETLRPLLPFESSEPETRNAKLETLRPLLPFESSEPETRNAKRETLPPGRKYSSVERMQPERLRAVHQDRLRIASERHRVALGMGLVDYRAILHAHAEDSSHTGGTRPELLAAARVAGVQIIMLSDHVRPERDFIDDSWRGLREGILFIPGAEGEGFLTYPMTSIRNKKWDSRDGYVRLIKEGGGNIFLSHVEEKLDWQTDELDGLEIYNHHTDVKDETAFSLWLRGVFTDPVRLAQIQQALSDYPQEVFGAQQDYLAPIIVKWDRDAQRHRLTGVAANDCHHNQVFTVTAVDDSTVEVGYITSRPTSTRVNAGQAAGVSELVKGHKAGELIARIDLDPYERSLRYVTTHILSERLTEPDIREALRRGHAYVAHDWLCDPTGFAFGEGDGGKLRAAMGDVVSLSRGLKLRAETPARCTLKLFHNGTEIKTVNSDRIEFEAKIAGVYRLEAWLTLDGEQRPWIYANPIYVR